MKYYQRYVLWYIGIYIIDLIIHIKLGFTMDPAYIAVTAAVLAWEEKTP